MMKYSCGEYNIFFIAELIKEAEEEYIYSLSYTENFKLKNVFVKVSTLCLH